MEEKRRGLHFYQAVSVTHRHSVKLKSPEVCTRVLGYVGMPKTLPRHKRM